MVETRPTKALISRIQMSSESWIELLNLNEEIQQCLLCGWEWKGVWVGTESVSTTFFVVTWLCPPIGVDVTISVS